MTKLVQTFADGTAVGALYALIALGYTLVYGILKFINFAHSDVFTLGAWTSLTVAAMLGVAVGTSGGLPPIYVGFSVLIASMTICGLVGFLIERLAYRPLRSAPRLNVLITAIGVSLLLQNIGQLQLARFGGNGGTAFSLPFGPYPGAMPPLLPDYVFSIIGITLSAVDLVVLVTAVVLMAGIELLIFHTRAGLAMRAVAYNHRTAALMGINVDRVISGTFVLGAVLAAAAGFLYSMKYPQLKQTADTAWVLLGLRAFVAAVVGGIGNVRGAMLGGLLLGIIEFMGVRYLSDKYRDVYVFSILIMVLLVRPSGILGKSGIEKV